MSSMSDVSSLTKFKHPGAKRLMREAHEMRNNTENDYYCAQPVEDNLFEWHFTLRGPRDTEFEGGVYHGRLSFPTDYPMKPPSIYLLTPNGRFETNRKICLSISGYHPETWQPSWSIRTALLALIGFMPTETNRALGSLDFSSSERRDLARKSRVWRCETCGPIKDLLKNPKDKSDNENKNSSTINRDTSGPSSPGSNEVYMRQTQRVSSETTVNETSIKLNDESVNNTNHVNNNTSNSAQVIKNQNNESGKLNPTNQTTVDELGQSKCNNALKSILVLILIVLLIRRMVAMLD